jgi:hypothetical protein
MLRVSCTLLFFGLAGCVNSQGPCNPFVSNTRSEVATFVNGAVTLTLDRTTTLPPVNVASATGFSCGAGFVGDPDAAFFELRCTDPATASSPWIGVFATPGDLRPLGVGKTTIEASVEFSRGDGSGCTTSASGTLEVLRAEGGAAAAPAYVTSSFLRAGTVQLDLEEASAVWTKEPSSPCIPPSLSLRMNGTFEQSAADYTTMDDPCHANLQK